MRKMLQKHFTVTIINMSERLTLKTAIKRSESTECLLKLDLHKNVFSCHRIVIMMMITMTIIIIVMIIIIKLIIVCRGNTNCTLSSNLVGQGQISPKCNHF